jgi:hypothetical protein
VKHPAGKQFVADTNVKQAVTWPQTTDINFFYAGNKTLVLQWEKHSNVKKKVVIAHFKVMISKLPRESFYRLGIQLLRAVFGHGHLFSVLRGRRNHQNVNIYVTDKHYQGKCFHTIEHLPKKKKKCNKQSLNN